MKWKLIHRPSLCSHNALVYDLTLVPGFRACFYISTYISLFLVLRIWSVVLFINVLLIHDAKYFIFIYLSIYIILYYMYYIIIYFIIFYIIYLIFIYLSIYLYRYIYDMCYAYPGPLLFMR